MSTTPMSPGKSNPANVFATPLHVVVSIIAVSAAASAFLLWLVRYHQPSDAAQAHFLFLPALNAGLNALCTIALLVGFRHIWRGHIVKHRNAMFAAFFFSSLFLVSYIANHALHGEMHFHGTGTVRWIFLYLLLLPHILLAVVALPMILITFFFSLSGRIPWHRRIAKYTFPVWLYVSATGVIVYAMLAVYK
jgi:putative membrane protein